MSSTHKKPGALAFFLALILTFTTPVVPMLLVISLIRGGDHLDQTWDSLVAWVDSVLAD